MESQELVASNHRRLLKRKGISTEKCFWRYCFWLDVDRSGTLVFGCIRKGMPINALVATVQHVLPCNV